LRAELNTVNKKLADTSNVDELKSKLDHKIGFINSLNSEASERERSMILERH